MATLAASAPPPSGSTNSEFNWRKKLNSLQKRFDAYKDRKKPDPDDSDYLSEDEEEEKNTPWEIMHNACMVANRAQMTSHPETPQILERVQALHSKVVSHLMDKEFNHTGTKSFADKPNTLVQDSMHSFMGHPQGDVLANAMSNFLGSFLGRPASPPAGRTILPWMKTQQPHPSSTRLSRFRPDVPFPSPSTHPLAVNALQARCEVYDEAISSPFRLALSEDSACLALTARGGYKERDPVLTYWLPTEGTGDHWQERNHVDVPLIEPGWHLVLDEARKLMFVADRDRVKSFTWDKKSSRPVHTLKSTRTHRGPLALLPNGRIIRAGEGSALCWTLDELPTHGPGPKHKRVGAGKYSWENCLRDREDEEEEYSTGSQPGTTLPLGGGFEPRIVHLHKPTGQLLGGEIPDKGFGCVALDMEHGGAVASRYLGHAGTITEFSTSAGDANIFLTAAGDGYVRLYDRRRPLPGLTFDIEKREAPVMAATFVHIDGLPIVFTGGNKTEGIKCWDVRARKCVYELSTGNTAVQGIAWSPETSTLYAASECTYQDWIGCHYDYRDFHTRAIQGTDILPPRKLSSHVYWPDRAIHTENAFGAAYDAGTHVLLRYVFKEQPELDVVPLYGDARPGGLDDLF